MCTNSTKKDIIIQIKNKGGQKDDISDTGRRLQKDGNRAMCRWCHIYLSVSQRACLCSSAVWKKDRKAGSKDRCTTTVSCGFGAFCHHLSLKSRKILLLLWDWRKKSAWSLRRACDRQGKVGRYRKNLRRCTVKRIQKRRFWLEWRCQCRDSGKWDGHVQTPCAWIFHGRQGQK